MTLHKHCVRMVCKKTPCLKWPLLPIPQVVTLHRFDCVTSEITKLVHRARSHFSVNILRVDILLYLKLTTAHFCIHNFVTGSLFVFTTNSLFPPGLPLQVDCSTAQSSCSVGMNNLCRQRTYSNYPLSCQLDSLSACSFKFMFIPLGHDMLQQKMNQLW